MISAGCMTSQVRRHISAAEMYTEGLVGKGTYLVHVAQDKRQCHGANNDPPVG